MRGRRTGGESHSGGFSLIEFVIVIAVFGILATALLDRLAYYEEAAEKAHMQATIRSIRNAMRTRMAELMISGRAQEYILMAEQNPFDWLETKPQNYRGEHVDPAPGEVDVGSWYFDPKERVLVYLVRNGNHFQPDSGGKKQVRLKVSYVFNMPGGIKRTSIPGPTDTVELRMVGHYIWQ